jgi:hypothetical protein
MITSLLQKLLIHVFRLAMFCLWLVGHLNIAFVCKGNFSVLGVFGPEDGNRTMLRSVENHSRASVTSHINRIHVAKFKTCVSNKCHGQCPVAMPVCDSRLEKA